jgi:hypothetical protein
VKTEVKERVLPKEELIQNDEIIMLRFKKNLHDQNLNQDSIKMLQSQGKFLMILQTEEMGEKNQNSLVEEKEENIKTILK